MPGKTFRQRLGTTAVNIPFRTLGKSIVTRTRVDECPEKMCCASHCASSGKSFLWLPWKHPVIPGRNPRFWKSRFQFGCVHSLQTRVCARVSTRRAVCVVCQQLLLRRLITLSTTWMRKRTAYITVLRLLKQLYPLWGKSPKKGHSLEGM